MCKAVNYSLDSTWLPVGHQAWHPPAIPYPQDQPTTPIQAISLARILPGWPYIPQYQGGSPTYTLYIAVSVGSHNFWSPFWSLEAFQPPHSLCQRNQQRDKGPGTPTHFSSFLYPYDFTGGQEGLGFVEFFMMQPQCLLPRTIELSSVFSAWLFSPLVFFLIIFILITLLKHCGYRSVCD